MGSKTDTTNAERQARHRQALNDDAGAYRELRRRAGEMGFCSVNDALDALAAQQN